MREDLEQRLIQRWPNWFNVHGDPQETAMVRGFAVGDGWFDLVWRLCEDLQPLVAEAEERKGERFEVLQVKEKFGGLRFYVSLITDAIFDRIEAASAESLGTCDVCGKAGTLVSVTRQVATRCAEHSRDS